MLSISQQEGHLYQETIESFWYFIFIVVWVWEDAAKYLLRHFAQVVKSVSLSPPASQLYLRDVVDKNMTQETWITALLQ